MAEKIVIETVKYECKECKLKYSSLKEAEDCEKFHFRFNVGDNVIYHTGQWGSSQGDFSPSWWPEEKNGKVIEIKMDKCLVEFDDKSRSWCENRSLALQKQGDNE